MDTIENLLRKAGRKSAWRNASGLPSDGLSAGGMTPSALPSIEALADFAQGRLPASAEESLEADLCADPLLRELLAFHHTGELQDSDPLPAPARVLEKVYALMPEKKSAWEVVVRFVRQELELLSFGGELLSARPLAVRSAGVSSEPNDRFTLKHQLDHYQALLTVQRQADSRASLSLDLRRPDGDSPGEFEVELWQDSQLRGARTGEGGAVSFTSLRPGSYKLVLQVAGAPVGELSLMLTSDTVRA